MKQVLSLIKSLTTTDEKTLTQKTLKLGEEFGELAKLVLPYENGFATTHRFVTSNKILEEVVDTLLCSFSIAYDLGFTDDDITDVMNQKCIKWSSLQQRSVTGKFPLPFEIHITVDMNNHEIDEFKNTCSIIGVKPIVIGLTDSVSHVMTSSVTITDNKGAFLEMQRISNKLKEYGFSVIREKIETVPWHPAVPTKWEDLYISNNQYFECHFSIVVNSYELEKLKAYCYTHYEYLHFSLNSFKQINENDFIQMVTFRSTNYYGNVDVRVCGGFTKVVDEIVERLGTISWLRPDAVQKYNIEYALYDTNITHDEEWITE